MLWRLRRYILSYKFSHTGFRYGKVIYGRNDKRTEKGCRVYCDIPSRL